MFIQLAYVEDLRPPLRAGRHAGTLTGPLRGVYVAGEVSLRERRGERRHALPGVDPARAVGLVEQRVDREQRQDHEEQQVAVPTVTGPRATHAPGLLPTLGDARRPLAQSSPSLKAAPHARRVQARRAPWERPTGGCAARPRRRRPPARARRGAR